MASSLSESLTRQNRTLSHAHTLIVRFKSASARVQKQFGRNTLNRFWD